MSNTEYHEFLAVLLYMSRKLYHFIFMAGLTTKFTVYSMYHVCVCVCGEVDENLGMGGFVVGLQLSLLNCYLQERGLIPDVNIGGVL